MTRLSQPSRTPKTTAGKEMHNCGMYRKSATGQLRQVRKSKKDRWKLKRVSHTTVASLDKMFIVLKTEPKDPQKKMRHLKLVISTATCLFNADSPRVHLRQF